MCFPCLKQVVLVNISICLVMPCSFEFFVPVLFLSAQFECSRGIKLWFNLECLYCGPNSLIASTIMVLLLWFAVTFFDHTCPDFEIAKWFKMLQILWSVLKFDSSLLHIDICSALAEPLLFVLYVFSSLFLSWILVICYMQLIIWMDLLNCNWRDTCFKRKDAYVIYELKRISDAKICYNR